LFDKQPFQPCFSQPDSFAYRKTGGKMEAINSTSYYTAKTSIQQAIFAQKFFRFKKNLALLPESRKTA
jgi:hypothetical protein